MEQFNIYGQKLNGKLEFNNKDQLKRWIDGLNEGDHVVAKFNTQEGYKSFRQVRLCYACLRSIMDKTGHSLEEVKYLMKKYQGLCAHHIIEGENIVFCKSISDFTKAELSDFILKMDIWSSEHLSHPLLNFEEKQFVKNIN